MRAYANKFKPEAKVTSGQFKGLVRSTLDYDGFKTHRLNIYWTRNAVGVTILKQQKDLVTYSFNCSSAPDSHKIGVALYCAVETVT